MRLLDLEPRFLTWRDVFEGDPGIAPAGGNFGDPYHHTLVHTVDSLQEAQGVGFLCPACYMKNAGSVGTHQVWVGFRDRGLLSHQSSQSKHGGPSRWEVNPNSTGAQDLTLSPSIDCGCWHGFVTDGGIT